MESADAGETVGLCLSPLDLAVSKLLAGREKDIAFVRIMLSHGLVDEAQLRESGLELTPEREVVLNDRLTIALRRN
jgi:hypothetical protein